MEKYLERIATEIHKESFQNPSPGYGLLGGKMGEILFFYYYSSINEKFKDLADTKLDKLIEDISEGNIYHASSFCNGFSGVGIGLHLLEEKGFIEGTDDMLDDLDDILTHTLIKDIAKNNYDFLHGAIGIGFYYLKHYKSNPVKSGENIKRIFDYLNISAVHDERTGGCKWIEIAKDLEDKNKIIRRYNLSLSHGMSSIIIFLSRILDKNIGGIDNTKVKELLERAITYIINQRIDYKIYGSYFPNIALENTETISKSRMAWCYGDLGIAMALWHGGKSLNRKDIAELAIEILLYSTTRTDINDTLAFDAGLCHGAAGIGQIFYRMYKETQEPELLNAYNFWKAETISMLYHNDGIGGHKKFNSKDKIWENSSAVLEGSAGVGLFLLTEQDPDWDEILLLNFK